MIFTVLALVFIAAVVVIVWRAWPRTAELDEAAYRAARELYAIRRKLDVARFKTQLKADAARLRRELRTGLQDES